METKEKSQKGKEQKNQQVQLSEREIKLRKMAEDVMKVLKKHNVKPFDRKQIYGIY